MNNAEFLELIKDDPIAIADYKKGLAELYSHGIYSEKQLIKLFTGKTMDQVNSEYMLPQLMQVRWALDFLMDNPCGDKYINRLAEGKKGK